MKLNVIDIKYIISKFVFIKKNACTFNTPNEEANLTEFASSDLRNFVQEYIFFTKLYILGILFTCSIQTHSRNNAVLF